MFLSYWLFFCDLEGKYMEKKIEPEACSNEEEEYLEYLVKKHGKRLGTKEEKYQVFEPNDD